MLTRVSLLVLTLLVSGCISEDMVVTRDYTGPNKVPTVRMAAHMQYRGFSILRPSDPRWYSYYGQQTPFEAIFHIEQPSPTHSFYAAVSNLRIAVQPSSIEDFKNYVDAERNQSSQRNEIIAYESTATNLQGQWCIRYKVKTWDKAARQSNEPLLMTIVGFVVLHPGWPKTAISAEYSERGQKEEITGDLNSLGEDFLSKVVLESAPGIRLVDKQNK